MKTQMKYFGEVRCPLDKTITITIQKINKIQIMSFEIYLIQFKISPSYFYLKNCMDSSRVTLWGPPTLDLYLLL